MAYMLIFLLKNVSSFCICKSSLLTIFPQKYLWIKYCAYYWTVNILTTNELVKLMMLWRNGPWLNIMLHYVTYDLGLHCLHSPVCLNTYSKYGMFPLRTTCTDLTCLTFTTLWHDKLMMLFFPSDLTFHANGLQFAWNVKVYFLGKLRKVFQNFVCWNYYPASWVLMLASYTYIYYTECTLSYWMYCNGKEIMLCM